MITKAEVYQQEVNGEMVYTVCPCIKLSGYYQHTKNKIVCTNKAEVSDAVWRVLNNKVVAMSLLVKVGMVLIPIGGLTMKPL